MIGFNTVLPSSRVMLDGLPSFSMAEIRWLRQELYGKPEEPLFSKIVCQSLSEKNLIESDYEITKEHQGSQVPTKLIVDTKLKTIKIIL